jgi:hypothetical protein
MKKLILILTVLSFGSLNNCRAQEDRVNKMGPDTHADVVVFFKKDTDWKQILEFHRTVIGEPAEKGTGYNILSGIMTVTRVMIAGYEGEAINFQPDATEEQRAYVKKRITESPLVFRVYENVIPDRITDLVGRRGS